MQNQQLSNDHQQRENNSNNPARNNYRNNHFLGNITVTDTQFRTPQSPFKFNASEWLFVSWDHCRKTNELFFMGFKNLPHQIDQSIIFPINQFVRKKILFIT